MYVLKGLRHVCACAHRVKYGPFVLKKVLINNVGCFE